MMSIGMLVSCPANPVYRAARATPRPARFESPPQGFDQAALSAIARTSPPGRMLWQEAMRRACTLTWFLDASGETKKAASRAAHLRGAYRTRNAFAPTSKSRSMPLMVLRPKFEVQKTDTGGVL
jgi:hypothetical protein